LVINLTQNEIRLIGCLIEKAITTPDHYPLSLNALTNACNQKSSRNPVLSLTEFEVQDTLDSLVEKNIVLTQSDKGSRVYKYKHRFCNSNFSELQFSEQQLGIICVLFLRGPQTPGELRTRTNRLCQFDNVQETEAVLNAMANAENGPYVIKLIREPGKRESRYAHCFMDQSEWETEVANDNNDLTKPKISSDRLSTLEHQVELMQLELDELKTTLKDVLERL